MDGYNEDNGYNEPANTYGQPTDAYGPPVNAYGQPVDEYGQPVNPYGQPADEYGQPVNPYGQPADEYGQPVNPYGQSADSYGGADIQYVQTTESYLQGDAGYTQTSGTYGSSSGQYDESAEEEEELTEEELEQLRRRKAAARRRKIAAREERRRKRRRQAIIRCSILLLIVILIIVGLVKMVSGIWNHFHQDKKSDKITEQVKTEDTEEPTTEQIKADIDEAILAQDLPADREAALEILKKQAETDPDIQGICDNAAVYPDNILMNLAVNSEMKQFAIDYPAKINITFDGDFTMDVTGNTVPLYLQFDEQWGYADYANNIVGLSGCGPTCLSMAYTYLKQDGSMNPIKIADFATEKGYIDESGNTSWTLMTEGAAELGLGSEELTASKDAMTTALENGSVIICSMSSGDFTKSGHFIVIREYKDGLFYVNDPNSEARSQVGWDYERLESQIANMWAISAKASDDRQTPQSDDSTQTDNPDSSQTSEQSQQ